MIAFKRGNYTRDLAGGDEPPGLEAAATAAMVLTRMDGRARRLFIRNESGDPQVWIERADSCGPFGAVVFLTVEKC